MENSSKTDESDDALGTYWIDTTDDDLEIHRINQPRPQPQWRGWLERLLCSFVCANAGAVIACFDKAGSYALPAALFLGSILSVVACIVPALLWMLCGSRSFALLAGGIVITAGSVRVFSYVLPGLFSA